MASTVYHANPFPGIRSYEISESHLFFGRESQVNELESKVMQSRFLAIVGSSGCGKSSLIKAGLIPGLINKHLSGSRSTFKMYTFRPADDPLTNLALALSDEFNAPDLIRNQLLTDKNGLVQVLTGLLPENQAALIYIDQFEELFRFKKSTNLAQSFEEAKLFIASVEHAVHQQNLPVYIILSMRTDFLDECTEFRGLSELINDGYYLVPRMNNEERKKAILGPVRGSGYEITDELIELLLNDVGEDPDQLPIMQHALMRTWDYWTMNRIGNQPIGVEHYRAIGTMKEALSIHLEEIYSDLKDEKSKSHAEKIFKALTDLTKEARGTRRPTPLWEICTLTGAREDEIIRIIDQFRSPGCAFLMPSAHISLDGNSMIDISHESIMRVWGRLKKWVEEEGESAQLYLRLSKSAELYQEGKSGLWVNPELQLALQWKELNRPNMTWAARYDLGFDRAMNFLNHSKNRYETEIANKERQQQRNLKRARNSAIILGAASVISILFLIVSLNLRFKAEASRKEAATKEKQAILERTKTEEQRKEAILQRKISEQQQQIAEQQEMISEQQRQYAVKQQIIAQEKTTEAVTQRKQADVARQYAVEANEEAQWQRKEALSQKQIADRERQKAEDSEREAQRLRFVTLANSLAIQALQLQATVKDEMPALLALAAYEINKANQGRVNDPDIYNALSAISSDPQILRAHSAAVRDILMHRNGTTLYSAGDDGKIFSWNLLDLNVKAELIYTATLGIGIRSLAFVDDYQSIAAATSEGKLILISLSDTKISPSSFSAHQSPFFLIPTNSGDDEFFSAGSDGLINHWSYQKQSLVLENLSQTGKSIKGIAYNPADQLLYTAFASGEMMVYSLTDKKILHTIPLKKIASAIHYSIITNQLALAFEDGSLDIYALHQPALPQLSLSFPARHSSPISQICFDLSGHQLLTSSYDWTIKLSNFPSADEKAITLSNHEFWVYDVLLSADGRSILSCGADKTIRIFSIKNDEMAEKLKKSLKRNLSEQEWSKLIGPDVPFIKLNPDLP
jgi:energy-coupling factor transporter ATP-binding protein EcfA2